MFGNGRSGKRKLVTVTQTQAEALNLFAKHYEVLGALLTLSHKEITEAIACGYETKEESE